MHPVRSVDNVLKIFFLDCEANCPLHIVPDPVCSTDGKTYDNKCKAECAGAEVQCKGNCPCGNYVIYYSNQTKRSTNLLI